MCYHHITNRNKENVTRNNKKKRKFLNFYSNQKKQLTKKKKTTKIPECQKSLAGARLWELPPPPVERRSPQGGQRVQSRA